MLRDYLLDIVKNTNCLGPDIIVRVSGDENQTELKAVRDDKTIILKAVMKEPVEDFEGVFGLGRLHILQGLLSLSGFKEKDANINIVREDRNGVAQATEILFKSPGAGTASYRLTHEAAIPKQYQDAKIEFDVEVKQPLKKKIAEFSQMAGIYAGVEEAFSVKTEDGKLLFLIGREESASHKAVFPFVDEVQGRIIPGYMWNINSFLSVLKLADGADCTIKFCNEVIQIDIDTGLCKYEFMLPGAN